MRRAAHSSGYYGLLKADGSRKGKRGLEVILRKNPLPFMTGTICAHNCMSKCTRNFYEASVNIRRTKLESAQGGIDAVMAALKAPAVTSDKKAAVVGGGLLVWQLHTSLQRAV